jgi:hypothetical protein
MYHSRSHDKQDGRVLRHDQVRVCSYLVRGNAIQVQFECGHRLLTEDLDEIPPLGSVVVCKECAHPS